MSRGCGSRQPDGLYACVPISSYGKPIEHFVIDPAIPIDLPPSHNLRAPLLLPDEDGVYHIILGIGKTYYPFVSDFIEETKHMGISKKLSKGFAKNYDFSKLDSKRSNLILIHGRAIPDFSYDINQEDYHRCFRLHSGRHLNDVNKFKPEELVQVDWMGKTHTMARHQCMGDNYALSSCLHVDEKHELEDMPDGTVQVTTPSCTYTVDPAYTMKGGQRMTWVDNSRYKKGMILRFPKFHFEYVRASIKETESEESEYQRGLEKIREVYADTGFGFRLVEE